MYRTKMKICTEMAPARPDPEGKSARGRGFPLGIKGAARLK